MFTKLLTLSKIHKSHDIKKCPTKFNIHTPKLAQWVNGNCLASSSIPMNPGKSRFPYRPGAISSRKLCPVSLILQPHWAFRHPITNQLGNAPTHKQGLYYLPPKLLMKVLKKRLTTGQNTNNFLK